MVSALIVIILNGLPIWSTTIDVFAKGIGDWIKDFIVVFTLGALLGSSLQSTGCAQAIAQSLTKKLGIKYVGLIIHILSLLMVYAGVDTVVAMLSIAPISIAMVRQANLPRRFAVACFLSGAASYVFGLPGSSAVNNLIPADSLGTSTLAAWLPGLLGSVVSLIYLLVYLSLLEKSLRKKGKGFDLTPEQVERDFGCRDQSQLPPAWVGYVPLLIVTLCSICLGGTGILPPKAAISAGLIVGTAFNLLFGRKFAQASVTKILEAGAGDGIVCSILTGAMLGFVAVIQTTDVFGAFLNWASSINLPPLLSVVFTILMMNLVLANSPGSINIFMSSFSGNMLAAGVQPAILHRVVAMSAAPLAAQMPHNPGSVILTSTYKCSYGEVFRDILVICVGAPLVGTLAAIGFITLGIV